MTTTTQQAGGDDRSGAWHNIETAEVEFLRNLADKGGLADSVAGMLRHCAKLIGCHAPFDESREKTAFIVWYTDGGKFEPDMTAGSHAHSAYEAWMQRAQRDANYTRAGSP